MKSKEELIVQPFTIEKDQLKNIEYICPASKNYNLHLNIGQNWELSKSGKVLYLTDDKGILGKKFIVSKTVFVLKKD